MSLNKRTRGKTQFSTPFFFADTSSTTGGGLSGVTSASGGLVMEYRRQGQSTWTNVTPQPLKTLGSYLSGGIAADTGLAGAYEVDFPDAAFASAAGVEWVQLRVRGVTNMLATISVIELDAVDYQDAAAFGLSKFADIETDTQDIQNRLPAALVDGRIAANAQVVGDKTGFKLASDGLALVTAWTVGITGNLTGNVTGSVGSISGVTFPANFSSMVINGGNGHVAVVVHAFQNGVLTAAAIAAGALNGKGDWLTTLGATAPAGWINAASITTDAITNDKIAASAVTKISTGVSNLEVLTRLASMIESDGAGQFRFDTIAVSLAVSGGAGGAVNITVEDRSITVT
jgi:hypothetical protein